MDISVFKELARAWYATAESMGRKPEDGSAGAQYGNGLHEGRKQQLENCAEQLERVLTIYSSLLK